MKKFTQILYIAFFTLTFALSQKNGDESNPYEFGFTIDGQQHRHEKKDVKGIIEGEFGFITADGIYHVTVYATDENGKFKILSMRNLRISAPLDGSPLRGELSPDADKYRKQAGLAPLPQAVAPPAKTAPNPLAVPQSVPEQQLVAITPKNEAPFRFTTQPTIKPACASCGYVTTPKPKPGQHGNGFQFQNPVFQKQDQQQQSQQPQQQQQQQPFGQSGSEPAGPLSVPIPIPPSEPLGVIEHRFDADEDNQFQAPQNTQIPGGQQQSQYPGNNLPQYQAAQGPQNTNYNTIGTAQYSSGSTQGAQYPSGGAQDSQYPSGGVQYSGGDQSAQYPSGGQGSSGESGVAQYSGGDQSAQYPSGGQGISGESGVAQYPSRVQNQNVQNPGYSGTVGQTNTGAGIENAGFGSNGIVGGNGFGGFTGSSGLGNQEAPNPLQVPSAEVSKFPPVAVSDGVIHVGGQHKQDITIKDKFPGMQDGLPEGIEEKDIGDLLYKFHYTVGFHGHYEKGLKNGAKVGGYFVNGRDGISRVVTYVADENGYRPKVKFINLGLTSDETPKPESEKTFGLKSFEFVWYPVE